jgi:hypothetical protein
MVDGTVELRVHFEPNDRELALSLFGEPGLGVAVARMSVGGPKKPERLYGQYAKDLKLSGFCSRREVWECLGTDDQYRQWVQRQASAWSSTFDYTSDNEPRCEAAHVRRIATGAGMQLKNDYACIPLTHEEHRQQSEKGENIFSSASETGREWMERIRNKYVEAWAWEELKKHFGMESMADVPPRDLLEWARFFNLENFLPESYREVGP